MLVIYWFVTFIHGNFPGFTGHNDGKLLVVFLFLYSQLSPQPLACQPHNNLCNNLRYGQTQKFSHLFIMGMNTGRDIDVRGVHTVITWLYTCRWQQNANTRRQEKFKFRIYSKFDSNLLQRLYKNSALFHLQVCMYV